MASIVTIRLTPRLPTKVAMAQFSNVQDAVGAVQEMLTSPYGAFVREFFDKAVNSTVNLDMTPFQSASNCLTLTVNIPSSIFVGRADQGSNSDETHQRRRSG